MTFTKKQLLMENVTVTTVKCSQALQEATSKHNISEFNTTVASPSDQNDALLYIITVLMFYACSIVILMVKYVRRERAEAEFTNYYYEFVSRDKFQEPQYQNFQQMCHIMKSLALGKGRKISPKESLTDGAGGIEIDQKVMQETPV